MKQHEKYDKLCEEIGKAFCEKYFCNEETTYEDLFIHCVGGDHTGFWGIQDYLFSIGDMYTALKFDIPEKTLFSWYDHALEAEERGNTYANLENYYLMRQETL